jgi:cytochrome c biogenesis protein
MMPSQLIGAVRALGSLKVTLVGVAAAGAVALTGIETGFPVGPAIALPFALLTVNLLAAIMSGPKLRRQAGLLGFHLALAVLAALAAVDRLAALNGHVEVTEGSDFDPALVEARIGPWHPWGLERVRFRQGTFEIGYGPGVKRRETVSRVYLADEAGAWRPVAVGDDRPLVAEGYRFYTSFNKGFAPLISFVDGQGAVHRGAVHLPSYPLNYYKQGNAWTPPGSPRPVKLWLRLPEQVFKEEEAWAFGKPEGARLVVIDGARRVELTPGESTALAGGRLRYEELRTWMGYTISYNPLVSWMAGAIVVGVLSLLAHTLAKTLRLPWHLVGSRRDLADAP